MTAKYETVFGLSVKTYADEEALNAVIEKFKKLMTDNGAEIESVDVWGKKRMAYEVNYETEAYYVLVNFTSDVTFPKELERNYRITEGVLRSIVVRK
ncbi:MAG: 30S ribosomal protein S6 [Clostridia bacterium]|nr:30S ribosomal protein S6 [Clostridia bacterium]